MALVGVWTVRAGIGEGRDLRLAILPGAIGLKVVEANESRKGSEEETLVASACEGSRGKRGGDG